MMNYLQKSLVVGFSLIAFSSHAALFDDTEARKKILDVEATLTANHEAQAAEIEGLNKRLSIQAQGLQTMQEEIEALRQELSQLRGDLEVANHALEMSEQRQKDLYADTDERIRKLEAGGTGPNATQAGVMPASDGEDGKAYEAAYVLTQSAKHQEALAAYQAFLKDYPQSTLVPNALYGMGYSQYVLKDYKGSIAAQKRMLADYPDNAKAPSAMYSMANSQIQLGQITDAKKTLGDLIQKFPNAPVRPNAEKRLKILQTIK